MGKYNNKGKRKYACADCGTPAMLHWTELARRCKPRCGKCGSTFFNPMSDGAVESEINAGTSKAIRDAKPPSLGTVAELQMMRGEREVPRRHAFTVTELLAVVVILAVLLSVALPALRQSRERAQADRCMADLRSIRDIAVIYHDHNRWRWPRRIEQLGLDPGAPLVCVRDRTPDPERSHDLWAPSIGMAIGTIETPTLESRVEQAAPPGLLMVSDIPLWCERQRVRRYGVWTGGKIGEVK